MKGGSHEGKRIHGKGCGVLLAVCAISLLLPGSLPAAETWADEIWNMVVFEKANYPGSNFDHYFEKLTKIRNGLVGGDQLVVRTETDRFLKMSANRAYGIHDVAADEIYHFALAVRPTENTASAAAIELGIGSEQPMGVPDHSINTPYEGEPKCKAEGRDYWLNVGFDPGASSVAAGFEVETITRTVEADSTIQAMVLVSTLGVACSQGYNSVPTA